MSAWRSLPPVGGSVVTEELAADLAELEENDGLDEQDDLAAYRHARQRARTRRLATGAAGLLGLAIIWQIVAMLANSIFLPSVTQRTPHPNVGLVFSGIIAIAILGLTLDACLRGLVYLADPSKRG